MEYYDKSEFKRKSGKYFGVPYDSQLEGQHARFFYLAFGFHGFRRCTIEGGDYFGLSNGLRYRPDFYLPGVHFFDSSQIGAYVEVKPKAPDSKTMEKMTELCCAQEKRMILMIGEPIFTQINNLSNDMSAWIISENGVVSKNNRFILSKDCNNVPTIYITNFNHEGIYVEKNFINEAERAGNFRFSEDGHSVLNDEYEDDDKYDIPF